jgi:hypothetical protein
MAAPPPNNDYAQETQKLKEVNEFIEKAFENTEKMSEKLKNSIKELAERAKEAGAFIEKAKSGFQGDELLERVGRTAQKVLEAATKENIQKSQELIELAKQRIELEEKIATLTIGSKEREEEEKALDDLEKNSKTKKAALEENEKKLKNLQALSEKYSKNVYGVFQNYLGIKDLTKTGFTTMFQNIEIGGVKMTKFRLLLNEAKDAFVKLVNPLNLINNILNVMSINTLKAVKQWDSMINEFERATGIVNQYDDLLFSLWRNNLDLGVSAEKAGQAYKVLINEFIGFTSVSKENKEKMGDMLVIMDRLGVSFEDFTKTTSFMMDVLGQSFESVSKFRGELMGLADQMGLPLQQVFKGFNEAAPKLTKWGNEATEVFKKLIVQAKGLRLSTSELLAVVENFDTFDEAVPKVARLNAILGGPYLNTIEMMKMKEDERAEAMIKAFHASGKMWETLSAQEKQAVARAAGINDLTVAQRMFTQSIEEHRKALQGSAVSEEEAKTRAEATLAIQEKLASIASAFAVLVRPIVAVIDQLLTWFLQFNDWVGGYLPEILLGGLTAIWFFTGGLKKAFTWFKELFSGGGEEGGGIFKSIGNFFKNTGELVKKGGVAIIDALKGIGGKVTEFMKSFGPKFVEGAGKIISAIGNVLKTAGTALINGIGAVGKALVTNAPYIILGAAVIAASIAILAAGLKALAWGIEAVDKAFSGVAKEQARVDMIKDMLQFGDAESRLEGLSKGLESVVESFTKFGDIPSDSIDNVESIMKSLKESLPEMATMKIGAQVIPFLESLGNIVQPLSVSSENTSKVFENVKTQIKEIAAIKPDKETVQALKELASIMKAQTEAKPMTFTAEINDHILAKFVTKTMNSAITPNTQAGKTINPVL